MGFMILTCGLGLWAAAVIHLFAHGFYKATLFLIIGSAIARHRRQALPRQQRRPAGNASFARRRSSLPALALGLALAAVPMPGR